MFDVFKTAEFKRALKFYIEEVKNNSKHFLISMSSAVIWCFLVVLHPYFIKRIVDDGIVANNQQTIIVFISFLIVIGYIRAASIGIRRYFSMSVSFNVEAEIRNSILVFQCTFRIRVLGRSRDSVRCHKDKRVRKMILIRVWLKLEFESG